MNEDAIRDGHLERTLTVEDLRVRGAGPGKPFAWWGMLLFMLTEAALFAYLIASYFYLRNALPVWPPEGIPMPELRLAAVNTGILLASSVPMHWALTGIRAGKRRRLQVGLLAGFLLGVTFLGIQAFEYGHQTFTPSTHAYGSAFFTITGFHGLHVLVGLGMNLYAQARAARGHFDAEDHTGLENCVLYWHFVDLVWIAVFSSLYLSPHLL